MTKRELLEVLDEFDMDEELDMNEVDFVHHFRAEEKKCRFMADKDYRIALYESGNESLVHASYPTLADAMKEYDIPEDVEFEQGLGQIFIAVPYSARKHA